MSSFNNIRSKLASLKKAKPLKDPKVYYDLDDDDDYAPVGVEGLLASSEKLLGINQGLAEEDERDSWAFKRIYGPDRLMRLRVKMDAGAGNVNILKGIARRVSRTKNLNSITPGSFNGYLEGAILGNPLSMPLEETNPLNLVTQHRRVTHMGPGGINSSDAITNEMQSVHPSQFSFISLLEGPESEKIGVDARFAWGTKLGNDGRVYTSMVDRRSGKRKWVSPWDLRGRTVKIPE